MFLRSRTLTTIVALVFILAACGSAATPAPTRAPTAAPTASAAASPSGPAATSAPATLSPSGAKVTLKILSGFAPNSVFNGPNRMLADALSARSGGRVTVTAAGPEVVPASEAITATARGVYDIHYTVPLFFTGIQPEGEAIYFISGNSSCAAYRAAGALSAFDAAHRAGVGVFFLGCGGGGAHGATFILKKPIVSIDEFKGMKFRGFGVYTRILDTLGASSVAMPPGEVLTALERGVIDAAAFPNLGLFEFGLTKVAPYIVMPPYLPFRYGFWMNPGSFAGLAKDVQDFLLATVYELEDDFDKYYVDARDKEAVQLKTSGMQEVRLSQAESDRLSRVIRTELWKYIVEKSPTYGPQIKTAFEKVEPPK